MILGQKPPKRQSKLVSHSIEHFQPAETLEALSYLDLYLRGE